MSDTGTTPERAPASAAAAPAERGLLTVGVQLAGAAAAIVLLLALLGGAVVALRLARSHLPVEAGLAAVPKSDLVGIGLAEVLGRIVVIAGPPVLGFGLGLVTSRGSKGTPPQNGVATWLWGAVLAFAAIGFIVSVPFTIGWVVEAVAALVALAASALLLALPHRNMHPRWRPRRLGSAAVITALLVAAIAPELDLPPRFDRISATTAVGVRISGYLVADTGSTYYIAIDRTLRPIAHSSARSIVISDPAKPSKGSQRSLLQRLFGG